MKISSSWDVFVNDAMRGYLLSFRNLEVEAMVKIDEGLREQL
jgi:hypothetical protein